MSDMSPDFLLLLVVVFFGFYIILQILIASRLSALTKYLLDILIELKTMSAKSRLKKQFSRPRNCAVCKYRVPFFDFQKKTQTMVYYRCQLTKKKVDPDYFCENFILDPQQKGA